MPYIHENPDWPNFHWNMEKLATLLAEVRYKQGLLLGRMIPLGFEIREEASLEILTEDVVKSSAIEGELLDERQVRSSLARNLGMDIGGLIPTDRHVDGVVEMTLDATRNFREPLTTERLFGWHASLFPSGRSGLRKITVGAWRSAESGTMQVVSGVIGREKIHFEAPDAVRLGEEMDHFLRWFNVPYEIDPLIKAGVAHLYFVTIHPFEDGNGRIARAIADMALAKADESAERFYGMSAFLEKERKAYYEVLESTQKGSLDITPWLMWFVGCLGRAIDGAEDTLCAVLRKARVWQHATQYPLTERQRLVINRLLDHFIGKLTSSKYATFAKCSQDTALRDIRELISWELLEQESAGGRSTAYVLVDR